MMLRRQKEDLLRINRVTYVGMAINVTLFFAKLYAGIAGRSQALIADAVHSVSDLATDIAVVIGIRFWAQPADRNHPYGHAKIETMVTLLIGAALALVAVQLIKEGATTLYAIGFKGEKLPVPKVGALYAALGSIVLKEALYRWTVKVGRETNSSAVIANAWHHRSDALSSIPAALAVGLALLLGPRMSWLDPAGAIVVALMIAYAAWQIARPAIIILLDAGMNAEQIEKIIALAVDTPGVLDVHQVRTRPTGSGEFVLDLHIHVDGEATVRAGHDIAETVARKIVDSPFPVSEVLVHFEPDRD
ncbi:MAG: cation diffusion facilitator family transporter [Victivallaceae bacterium]